MPTRIASISELLNSLDAATYFFVSSGLFIVVAAVLFFVLGLWLGGLIWAHYKRRFRQAELAIEAFKAEVALLKRRLAEQSTRPSPAMGPSPLQSIAFRTASPSESAPSAAPTVPSLSRESVHTGAPFTLWTEPEWNLAPPPQTHLREAIHAEPPAPKSTRQDWHAGRGSSTTAALPAWRLLFAPTEVFMVPRSHAFCLWTERTWNPHPIKSAPLPAAQGFALWTEADFTPLCRGPLWTSRAHTLWCSPG
jgi:hypothetical protein